MNLLFLTLVDFDSITEPNIYTDLLREFLKNGHQLYVISPVERRKKQETYLIEEDHCCILKLKIGNTQKTNMIEKGISTFSIEPIFIRGIKKYFSQVKFDLVLYSTPPITFCKAIAYVKKRDHARTYLLLKDIFPQNAVDIGLLSKTGIKGFLYHFFRKKERKLYEISDTIGCMSQANVDYVIRNNSQVNPNKVEVCPNSIEVVDQSISMEVRESVRKKYGIPLNREVFVYGGNLGKPQGIDFLIECLKSQAQNHKAYFLIVGDGTEYSKLENYIQKEKPNHIKLMKRLPKEDYDHMVAACDVGMIFLDYRFTIPNFPSRLLAYMQAKVPVLAATDRNTDIGKIIMQGGFGWWCESKDVKSFSELVQIALDAKRYQMGELGYHCLTKNYTAELSYKIIEKRLLSEG